MQHRVAAVRILTWLLALLLLLAACGLLITAYWKMQARMASWRGAVLIICSASQSPDGFGLLRASLHQAGLDSRIVRAPAIDAADTSLDDLQAAVADLAAGAELPADRIWLAAAGDGALPAWRIATRLENIAGLLLLSPKNLAGLAPAETDAWPAGRSLALYTAGLSADAAASSRHLFAAVSGEDASLLPGQQSAGLFASIQYTSVDGLVRLAIFPALPEVLTLVSPRLEPSAARWLSESLPDPPDAAALAAQSRRTSQIILFLVLAGLLLLALPFALSLALGSMSQPDAERSEAPRRASWWLEILLWLPAAALAGGLGWLMARLAGGNSWLFCAIAIVPGTRGWLFVLVRRVRLNWLAGDNQPALEPLVPAQPARVAAGLLAAALPLLALAWWQYLLFGPLLPPGWSWLLLPFIVLANYPAGLAGTVGWIGAACHENDIYRADFLSSLWQHLPFLILPAVLVLERGLTGLGAALLLLIVSVCAVALGKAVTLLSRQAVLGSLAQSVLFSLAVFLPPVMAGLQA